MLVVSPPDFGPIKSRSALPPVSPLWLIHNVFSFWSKPIKSSVRRRYGYTACRPCCPSPGRTGTARAARAYCRCIACSSNPFFFPSSLLLQLGILTVQPLVESLPRKNEGLERRTVQPISATMPMPFNSLNAGTKPTRRRCQQTCWRQTVQGALHVCSNQPTAIVLPFFLTH